MSKEQRIVRRMKEIGDKPAFPVSVRPEPGTETFWGISYREWLFGQALASGAVWYEAVGALDYVLREMAVREIDAEDEVGMASHG